MDNLWIIYGYGWWLTRPLWKIWVRQLGWWFPIYGQIKHVPNHQPDGHLLIMVLMILIIINVHHDNHIIMMFLNVNHESHDDVIWCHLMIIAILILWSTSPHPKTDLTDQRLGHLFGSSARTGASLADDFVEADLPEEIDIAYGYREIVVSCKISMRCLGMICGRCLFYSRFVGIVDVEEALKQLMSR